MTELTLVAWVRTSNVAGFDNGIQRLVSKGRSFEYNYSLYLQNGRAAVTAWQFAGADHLIVRQGTSLVADSRWYLLVGVIRNGAFAQLYVDGVLEGEDLTPTGTWNRTGLGDFTIGRYPDIDDWNEPYDGDIDDVRVYRRAFTAQEVASLYASEHP